MALSELEYNLMRVGLDAEDFEFMHITSDTEDELEAVDEFEFYQPSEEVVG